MDFADFDLHFYDAYLEINDSTKVKFFMILDRENESLTIVNGEERINVSPIHLTRESLVFEMPVFRSRIEAKFDSKNSFHNLEGTWYKFPGRRDYAMPFYAVNSWSVFSPDRFEDDQIEHPPAKVDMSGNWEVVFSPGTEDAYDAIGEFQQDGNKLTGTFRTATGDYRYLAGVVYDDKFKLSCFDGSHAFLFKGTVSGGNKIEASFWSGNHWEEPWTATKNEAAALPDPNAVTFLTTGKDSINFFVTDMKGYKRTFVPSDYDDKVLIINIFGTWCPNCMDETRFLVDLHDRYHDRGLEILGIAYERSDDPVSEMTNLLRYKKEMGIDYEIYFAGKANKKEASADFPMLNGIFSFPTMIVMDKLKQIRMIHTGFSGPATSVYESFTTEFEALLEEMVAVGQSAEDSTPILSDPKEGTTVPKIDPIVEPVIEPVAEPVAEPVTKPAIQQVIEPVSEKVNKRKARRKKK